MNSIGFNPQMAFPILNISQTHPCNFYSQQQGLEYFPLNQVASEFMQVSQDSQGKSLLPFSNPRIFVSKVPYQRLVSHPPFAIPKVMRRQGGKKCEGRKNLLNDIGLVSLITSVISTLIGLYTILVNSVTSSNIGTLSGVFSLVLWAPSTVISLFNIAGPLVTGFSNLLNLLTLLNTVYGFFGVVFGGFDMVSSVLSLAIGVLSLGLGFIATFPDLLNALIDLVLTNVRNRRRISALFENYGCPGGIPGLLSFAGRNLFDVANTLLVNLTKLGFGKNG